MANKNPYYALVKVGDPVYLYDFHKETGRHSKEVYHVKDLALELRKVADGDDSGPRGSVFHAETVGGRQLKGGEYFNSYWFGDVMEHEEYYSVCLSEDNLSLAYELVVSHIIKSIAKSINEYKNLLNTYDALCTSAVMKMQNSSFIRENYSF